MQSRVSWRHLTGCGGMTRTVAHLVECQWNANPVDLGTPKMLKKRLGPEPTDVSELTRHRLWAWTVYLTTPQVTSWDALDRYWLSKIDGGTPTDEQTVEQRGRRRVFHRYFQVGNSPEKLRGINGRMLIDTVHGDPSQAAARALYLSPLWELTSVDEPPLDRVREIQAGLLLKLGLIRLTPTERVLARLNGYATVARHTHDIRDIEESAYNIGAYASVDSIALLGCSFRIALDALSLQEAEAYLSALRWSIARYLRQWHATDPVRDAVVGLIELRLLRRTSIPVVPELLGFKRRSRRRKEESPEAKLSRRPSLLLAHKKTRYAPPIVPLDASMDAFLDNFERNYGWLRDQILQKLSVKRESIEADHNPDTEEVLKQRLFVVETVLLQILHSDDEAADEYIDSLEIKQFFGGLPKILHQLFVVEASIDEACI